MNAGPAQLSFSRLEAFLLIIDEGGLTNAARTLGVSQPTLSSTLARLERDITFRLFERLPTGLSLTSAGRRLEPVARRALANRRSMETAVAALREGERSRLRIASVRGDEFAWVLPRVVRRFHNDFPTVKLQFVDRAANREVLHAVKSAQCEVGLLIGQHEPDGLSHVHLPATPMSLLLPSYYPPDTTLSTLALESSIPLAIHADRSPSASAVLAARQIRSTVVASFDSLEAVPGILLLDVAAAVVPTSFARAMSSWGRIALPLPELHHFTTVVYRSNHAGPLLPAFLDAAVTRQSTART